ncbi:MAG: 7-cyano-7-deazaguanine synthase [Nanoarchaeota archaeon]
MKNGIILCSGGIDSITTAHYVREKLKYGKIIILFFDYNQKALKSERKFSKMCAKKLHAKFYKIKLKWLGKTSNSLINKSGEIKNIKRKELKNAKKESEKFYVPCRNLIFLSHTLALAESLFAKEKKKWDIFVGFKNEGRESYPDTTKGFVSQINKLAKLCSAALEIKAPLINKDKEDIISLGKKLGVDFRNTFSCYIGKKKHCGYCLACRLRQEGFYWANVKDPTEYNVKMKDFRLAK